MANLIIGSSGFLSQEVRRFTHINDWIWATSSDNSAEVRLNIFDSDTYSILNTLDINTCLILSWPFLPNYESDIHLHATLPAIKMLIDYLLQVNINHIIGVGSCYEYGCRTGCLNEKDSSYGYITPYGEAKSRVKDYLIERCELNNVNWTWIRPFYLFSQNQRENALYPSILRHIALGKESIEVNSNISRDFVSTQKFVELLDACIDEKLSYNKVINCSSGTAIQVSKFAQDLINSHGSGLKVIERDGQTRSYEPNHAWGNNVRMNQILQLNGLQ